MPPLRSIVAVAWSALRHRVSLLEDKAADDTIDRELRNGVEMRGTNLWVLMFAIFIASIGLNVNSTAVIIGAMLISPLMGPILGLGYGVGVLDIELIRRSLKNLAIAVGIALATSSLYFLISPLNSADSELLARTTPTIWDVLIALFGGFAGIIGVTRKEKSNIIPGVAIATALMPPLCTAGYGIAHGNWSFIGGAFFLFAINSVFIAFSSAIVVRAFHVRETRYVDSAVATRVRRYVTAVVVVTLLPSTYFAYRMVQHEVFRARAHTFVARQFNDGNTHVTQTQINARSRVIELTLMGDYIGNARQQTLAAALPESGLQNARLVLHQMKDHEIDVSQLKSSLLSDLYARSQQRIEEKDQQLEAYRLAQQESVANQLRLRAIADELAVLFPGVRDITVTEGRQPEGGAYLLVVNAVSVRSLGGREVQRMHDWLAVRIPQSKVLVAIRPVSARVAPLP